MFDLDLEANNSFGEITHANPTETRPNRPANLCAFQHAGDGLEPHDWSNHYSLTQCPFGRAVHGGKFCFDATCRHRTRCAFATRPIVRCGTLALGRCRRRAIPAEVSSAREGEPRIRSGSDGAANGYHSWLSTACVASISAGSFCQPCEDRPLVILPSACSAGCCACGQRTFSVCRGAYNAAAQSDRQPEPHSLGTPSRHHKH